MLKTYSRGRAAVAAAKKALGHLDTFIADISPADHGDKFTAIVAVKPGGGKEIVDAITAAGFGAISGKVDPAAPNPETVAALEAVEAGDVHRVESIDELFDDLGDEAEDDPEDTVSDILDDMGEDVGEPLTAVAPKGRGGYINEVSSTMGACELARSIAQQMPNAPRKEVIAACRQAGIAYGTARTQIQRVRGGK